MPSVRQQRGSAAEDQAADFLQAKGFIILDRHVTSRFGEIDILARDGETLVAVEVKYRASDAMGRAVESVTPQKIEKIYTTLEEYCLQEKVLSDKIRIDVMVVESNHFEHIIGIE